MNVEFTDLKPLGRGANGSIFRAVNTDANMPIAVKFIDNSFEPIERQIQVHVEALKQIHHTNVVSVLDIVRLARPGSLDARPELAIVMKLIEGQPLDQWLATSARSTTDFARICAGILNGLEAFHENGVFHGDLHSGNIMVATGREPVIIDAMIHNPTIAATTVGNAEAIKRDVREAYHLVHRVATECNLRNETIAKLYEFAGLPLSLSSLRSVVKLAIETPTSPPVPSAGGTSVPIARWKALLTSPTAHLDFDEAVVARAKEVTLRVGSGVLDRAAIQDDMTFRNRLELYQSSVSDLCDLARLVARESSDTFEGSVRRSIASLARHKSVNGQVRMQAWVLTERIPATLIWYTLGISLLKESRWKRLASMLRDNVSVTVDSESQPACSALHSSAAVPLHLARLVYHDRITASSELVCDRLFERFEPVFDSRDSYNAVFDRFELTATILARSMSRSAGSGCFAWRSFHRRRPNPSDVFRFIAGDNDPTVLVTEGVFPPTIPTTKVIEAMGGEWSSL